MPPETDVCLSEIEAARLLRKIDLHVLPMLFMVSVAAFLDRRVMFCIRKSKESTADICVFCRANMSNALTMGMPKEIGLTGQQPNIALVIFFVPYILFEVPSNVLMKRFSPHVWLAICTFGFGIVMIGQGFVMNFSGLIATRFFLGFFEAGILPGSLYLISFWYEREQSQKRFTIYFCAIMVASAFGGLLATGIAEMDGTHGKSNWRWVFILEGIITSLVALAAYFFISDFPSKAKWLTETERKFILSRTEEHKTADMRITRKDLVHYFKEPTSYLVAIMCFCK